MKNKKTIYILVSILAVCLLGVVLSKVINWPVDTSKSSGNIAKTSRFNRKTASDGASNMQELLLNDEEYKNSVVAAYLVMDARANQFNTLVDASDEVAGNIPAFSDVLKDMKAAKPLLSNVCAQMKTLASDLDAVLGGETRADLAQNTTNAALAYNTLQKSNNLATRFIDAADAYLAKNAGDDRLKFIRDQWVEYQMVTASLNNDEAAAADLAKKGHLLSAEKSAAALGALPGDISTVIAACSGVNAAINAGITSLQANNTSLQANNTTLQANNTSLQANNTSLQANNTSLQANNTSLQANNTSLQANNTTLQANNTSLQANNTSLQANNTTLQANNTSLQANNTMLQANNTSLQAAATTLHAGATYLQAATATLQANNTNLGMANGVTSLGAAVGTAIQSAAAGEVTTLGFF